jgi:uncharacterized membrane protein YdfJ with MMPL/SSD domain
MPITAVSLIVVFAGLVAAGLPLLGMIITTMGAIGMLLVFSNFIRMEPSVVNVVTMLGMALSIDYGLLLVARYREELAVSEDRLAAVARTWGTAGRTVAFSGLTVAVALTSLLFVDLSFVQAIGSAGIATAVVAMAVSLTLTPALLRLSRGRVKARMRPLSDKGLFISLARFTQRRPWLVVVGTAGLLLAVTAPIFATAFKNSGLDSLPADIESVGVAQELDLMVMVFDWGWLSGPLDTLPMDGVNPINLVMIFAFATALAMDYEMFLLGCIAELVSGGMPTDLAVREGLQRSGRLITSAALLMLIVYARFSSAKVGDIEQIGVGLFTAVLIDATVVRCLLVPSTMTLLGRWNWWAPAFLTNVHKRVGVSESEKELVNA